MQKCGSIPFDTVALEGPLGIRARNPFTISAWIKVPRNSMDPSYDPDVAMFVGSLDEACVFDHKLTPTTVWSMYAHTDV